MKKSLGPGSQAGSQRVALHSRTRRSPPRMVERLDSEVDSATGSDVEDDDDNDTDDFGVEDNSDRRKASPRLSHVNVPRGSGPPGPHPRGLSSSVKRSATSRKSLGGPAPHRSRPRIKATRRRSHNNDSAHRRVLPQPLGPSSPVEELLHSARYSLPPSFRRKLLEARFKALGNHNYEAVASVPRPIPPKPAKREPRPTRRKIRSGYDDEDMSDEELDVSHLPITNPSYSKMLSRFDRATLRKGTVRGAKKMLPLRELSVESMLPHIPLPNDEDGPKSGNPEREQDPLFLPDSDAAEDEEAPFDREASGSPDFQPPDDVDHFQTGPPVPALVDAFEEADQDGYCRRWTQTTGKRSPFLKRNMRAVFEHQVRRRRDAKASAAGYLAAEPNPLLRHGRPYDQDRVLDEESVVKDSRRAKRVVVQLKRIYLPTNFVPHACSLSVELHLNQTAGEAKRFSLLRADITIPQPRQDQQSGRYFIEFQPPLRAKSELIPFWSIPEPYTASGAIVVLRLFRFKGSGGGTSSWVFPGTASSPSGAGEKAEIKLKVISDDDPALFLSTDSKIVPLTWVEGRNLPQYGSKSPFTATLSLSWEFEPTGLFRPPLKKLRFTQASLVVVEFWHDEEHWKVKQHGWRCPLCDRFGVFSDPFFLECHIQAHHECVDCLIEQDSVRNPRIVLTAQPPQSFPTLPQAVFEDEDRIIEQDIALASRADSVRMRETHTHRRAQAEEDIEASSHESAVQPSRSPTPQILEFVPDVNTAREPIPRSPGRAPAVFIDLTRDSPEPLPKDRLGPADTPKAGTYTSAYELTVFDILSELPTEAFGNQGNRILTQIELIYERKELPVEDRVIAALWTRWIVVNRGKFLEDYVLGFKAFVSSSSDVIRRGAGIRALRNFLLMMAEYRFLDPQGLLDVLDAYQEAVAEGVGV